MNYPNIEKAVNIINANYTQPISLGDLSKKCCMSKYHFSRVFKKVTGKTFKNFHNHKRIEAAKSLLNDNELSITEICFSIGFNDLSYFNKVFHKYVEMSPSDYKKKQIKYRSDKANNKKGKSLQIFSFDSISIQRFPTAW